MSQLVADHIVDRLKEWGVSPYLRLSGRRHQRADGRARSQFGVDRLHPGAPRGDGGVHGLRARQVHGRGRGLPGDLGPRGDPPAQRPVRRQARPPARAWRSSASRPACRWAATTSRRSTSRSLFKDVAHEYVQMATEPAQVRHLVDRAVRIATAERTVTCVIVPNDLQEEAAVQTPPREHGPSTPASATARRASFPARRISRARPRS